jgi:hypothetical protein
MVSLLGQITLIEAPKCESGAYRITRIWQNLMLSSKLRVAHGRLPAPQRPVQTGLDNAGLHEWSEHSIYISSPHPAEGSPTTPTDADPSYKEPLFHLGTHPNSLHIRITMDFRDVDCFT